MSLPRLLLLTDRTQLPPDRGLVGTVVACVQAGLTHVIVRELDQPPGHRHQLIKVLAAVPGLTLISGHRPHPDAVGVHLAATQQRLPEWWHGRSCHTARQVEQAADEGAAYATLAPYAATSTPGYGPPVDQAEFRGHRIPVFALGGINVTNARAALDAGAHGVAVMSEVMRAPDPARVVGELLAALS